MAGLVLQSRFAGLLVEDEDFSSSSDNQKKKNKNGSAKKTEPAKKAKPVPSKTQVPKKKKPKQPAPSGNQWEQWKQKDEQLVDGNFEEELQQAILLSKLDYEEKKDVYQQFKKESDVSKKTEAAAKATSAKKQQKKKNVMSLDQFNDMVTGGEENKTNQEEDNVTEQKTEKPKEDTEFFERVKSETKNELLKDKIIDRVKSRQQTPDINRVQFADALERKDKEIDALREEVTNLKKELLTVKSRNKKLCNILGQGEMKDKAEVLVEVERLRAVQHELTAEIASLHTDLEKERSKNGDPKAKDKKNSARKKNIRFDVSSEAILAKESSTATA